MQRGIFACLFAGCALIILAPTQASAQSTIQGTVKDTSGAVMPNVTVVASSPALIEGSRTATTNGEGRYDIIDVRPGVYSVKFTATGFQTQQRDRVEVLTNTTATINSDMTVGSTGETISVEAVGAVVDTENAANHQVLTREIIDSIPAPRNMQALGGLTPGIVLRNGAGANPDVGGSQQMEQTYITGHGSNANQTTVLLDGMNINTNYLDGTIQNYVDNGIIQEATYQTSGVNAEYSAGGVLVNQIPKDGGNSFHGDAFLGYTGQGTPWQASNLSKSLEDRFAAFNARPSVNAIVFIKDYNVTVGGPIIKNKLWFLSSYRYQSTFDSPANVFKADKVTPAVEDQHIAQGVMRLSWQISSKDKFSGTYDRIQKQKGHELSNLTILPDDPEISAQRRGPPLYYVAQGKWTRVQSSNLLFDGGFSTDILHFSVIYQPGQEEVPFSPAWYTHVTKVDSFFSRRSNAPGAQSYLLSDKRNVAFNATYITHNHTIRTGITDAWGKNDRVASMNGDLTANFSNGVAQSVTVTNNPVAVRVRQDVDLGIFATDTWHFKRLVLTAGLRYEYEKSSIGASSVPGGRFVGARSFNKIDCTTIKGLGCWKTWSPRIGMVYDLIGNGKTVVKASFGTYNIPQVTGYLGSFNPMTGVAESRAWTDEARDAKGVVLPNAASLPGYHDGTPQDNEIAPGSPSFGLASSTPALDPNFKREFAKQYSAGFTREIKQGYGISFNWFRRTDHNASLIVNRAVDPVKDWTPFQITNPLDGSSITAYTINAAAKARVSDLYQTNVDPEKRSNVYTGYETAFNAKLPHRGHLMTAWTVDRVTDVACDAPVGASLLGLLVIHGNGTVNSTYNNPNSLRFCDERGKLPFRHELKIIATMPLKWGIEGSAILQSSPEDFKYLNWDITAASLYSADCVGCVAGGRVTVNNPTGTILNGSERIQLAEPGTRYSDRLNQVDLGLKKTFKLREKLRIQAQLDVFNVMNSSTVLVETQGLGVTAKSATAAAATYSIAPFVVGGQGGRPTSILQGRLMRLAVQFHF